MAHRVYCIEVAKENRDKAEAIMHGLCVDGDINIKYLEYSHLGRITTVQYWLTSNCDELVDHVEFKLKENGIELF